MEVLGRRITCMRRCAGVHHWRPGRRRRGGRFTGKDETHRVRHGAKRRRKDGRWRGAGRVAVWVGVMMAAGCELVGCACQCDDQPAAGEGGGVGGWRRLVGLAQTGEWWREPGRLGGVGRRETRGRRRWRGASSGGLRAEMKMLPCSSLLPFAPRAARAMRGSHCLFVHKERRDPATTAMRLRGGGTCWKGVRRCPDPDSLPHWQAVGVLV